MSISEPSSQCLYLPLEEITHELCSRTEVPNLFIINMSVHWQMRPHTIICPYFDRNPQYTTCMTLNYYDTMYRGGKSTEKNPAQGKSIVTLVRIYSKYKCKY